MKVMIKNIFKSHVFCIFIFIFVFLFYFVSLFSNLLKMEIPRILHLWSKQPQHVGAGIDTLMSISDGLGSSIFCRKMGKARPMMEEMGGKVVHFPPESAFLTFERLFPEVFFPICTLTWRVNNYVSRREKV